MEKGLVALIIFLILAGTTGFSEEASQEEKAFVGQVVHTLDALHADHQKVWADYDISLSPIVIVFGNGHIYAFNLQAKSSEWQNQKIRGSTVLFSEKDSWGLSQIAMQSGFVIDGQESFVFNLGITQNNVSMQQQLLVLVHELFHLYQFEHFQGIKEKGAYVDQANVANLALIYVEDRILLDYLHSPKKGRKEHLKNFLAINKTRQGILQESSILWEKHQQIMEGLADYVSIKTYDQFNILPGFSGRTHLFKISSRQLGGDITQNAIKWRHYSLGATLGYALDEMNVKNWKKHVQNNEKSQSELLHEKIPLTQEQVSMRTEKIKKRYNFSGIKANLQKEIAVREANMHELLEDYEAVEGITITIENPADTKINGGGTSAGIFHMANGSTVSVKDISYAMSDDNLWKLELKEIPFVFQNQAGDRILKLDDQTKVELDGKSYRFQELAVMNSAVSFTTIVWDGDQCSFESNGRSGRVEVIDGKVNIRF